MKWVWKAGIFPITNESEKAKIVHNPEMKTIMTIKNLETLEDLELFLEGNQQVAFTVPGNKTERYQFIRTTLIKLGD